MIGMPGVRSSQTSARWAQLGLASACVLLLLMRQAAAQATVVSSSKLQSCVADGTVSSLNSVPVPDRLQNT